ncbi:NAD-dependent epimerase/dehydratase family protein [Dissulfurispira sp.]|uniref:NAD-dependent epimerase/dehydratase family protein n=1 Tax=Dissulfurispira sp. TaxID=2817609 RepID=UPI002FD94197
MKALITGATGFIGSHLAGALIREGFDVACLVRNPANLRFLEDINAGIIKGDCTDRESLADAVKGVDYVFHLAGLTKACSEADFFNANVKGTENIVQAVLENNSHIKRFVYLSSLAAAGPSCDGRPLKEDSEPAPVSVYGKTKLEGEKIVLANKKNMPVTVIRPPAVYGPRDRDLLIFFKMIKSGLIPYWGKCYYSFLYVEDLINGIILSALSRDAEGEIFFVSDGNIYSTDDIIEAISDALQKRPVRLNIPKFVMPLLGFISEKAKGARKGINIINTDKIKEMRHSHWICDTTRAAERLKFEPKVKIKEGAKWTADWYRIHQWL